MVDCEERAATISIQPARRCALGNGLVCKGTVRRPSGGRDCASDDSKIRFFWRPPLPYAREKDERSQYFFRNHLATLV